MTELEENIYNHIQNLYESSQNDVSYYYSRDAVTRDLEQKAVENLEKNGYLIIKSHAIGCVLVALN